MVTHLGLPEWQYSFTPYGPSPQAKVPEFISIISSSIQINVFITNLQNIKIWQMLHTGLKY